MKRVNRRMEILESPGWRKRSGCNRRTNASGDPIAGGKVCFSGVFSDFGRPVRSRCRLATTPSPTIDAFAQHGGQWERRAKRRPVERNLVSPRLHYRLLQLPHSTQSDRVSGENRSIGQQALPNCYHFPGLLVRANGNARPIWIDWESPDGQNESNSIRTAPRWSLASTIE